MLPEELKNEAVRKAQKLGVSLGEVIREALELHLRRSDQTRGEDSLFADDAVFDREGPDDVSINHDRYLYGDKS